MVGAALMARLYGMRSRDALERVQFHHDARVVCADAKRTYSAPQTVEQVGERAASNRIESNRIETNRIESNRETKRIESNRIETCKTGEQQVGRVPFVSRGDECERARRGWSGCFSSHPRQYLDRHALDQPPHSTVTVITTVFLARDAYI